MKSKAFFNKTIAIMTAVMVSIQPSTAFASEGVQNPTEASSKVKYEGLDDYYSVVVPTTIQLKPDGTANFNVKVEGELGEWGVGTMRKPTGEVPILFLDKVKIAIYTEDEEGVLYPGCYLYQEGKEPIFAEFHEEAMKNYMEQQGIDYKGIDDACCVFFCNSLPDWVRNLGAAELVPGLVPDEYAGYYSTMSKEQFSHSWFGYDMGTEVPITVNLEGNKLVPAGKWKGEIVIEIDKILGVIPVSDKIPETQKACEELAANGQGY